MSKISVRMKQVRTVQGRRAQDIPRMVDCARLTDKSNCEQFKFRSSGERSLNNFNRVLYLVTLLVNLQYSDHVYDECLQLNPVIYSTIDLH